METRNEKRVLDLSFIDMIESIYAIKVRGGANGVNVYPAPEAPGFSLAMRNGGQ